MSALSGHAQLLNAQRPLDEVLVDLSLSEQTRHALKTMLKAREFASEELRLPDNDSYRNYADLGRKYAVWNVVATPAFSLTAKQWCFVFVGCISYRGYYQQAQAEKYAAVLQAQGFDVQVVGARAYSTLGWSDDPLLNTMLYRSEARRVGIIFHELAHQQLFIKGDTSFNEAFASLIEEEGVRRWFISQKKTEAFQHYLDEQQRDAGFKKMLLQTREKLQNLYRQNRTAENMQKEKARIFLDLKAEFKALKKIQPVFSAYDHWMAQDLNNAHLALVATYFDYVPAFAQLLKDEQGDLPAFYMAAEKLAAQEPQQRRLQLQQWAKKAR